jgi:hypothetical protein
MEAVTDESQALLRFNNLPSGNYILRFRKLNGFGIKIILTRKFRFTIRTPWYRQTWFYFLAIAASWNRFCSSSSCDCNSIKNSSENWNYKCEKNKRTAGKE